MNKENIITEDDITLAEEKNDVASAESSFVSNDKIVHFGKQTKTKENLTAVEVPELRDKNKKVFNLSDGTQQAVFYPHDIHFFDDETQSYQEIENVIVEENDGKHFTCKNPHFTAKFSREENNDELFKIEHGMQRVTVLAKKSHKQHKGIKPTLHKKPKHNINSDIVCFSNAEPNVDYEYSVDTNGVKEDIIVKEKASIYRYPFILKCENVTAEYDEANKRVSFLSHETGEEVFFIPAPFMKDANNNISYDVSYELKNLSNGDIQLTVIADSSWINSEERVLPVTIDPQISTWHHGAIYTYSWENGVIKGAGSMGTELPLRQYCTTGSNPKLVEQRMYLQLFKPTLPKNPRIKKAELELTVMNCSPNTEKTYTFGLYSVIEDITVGNCTPKYEPMIIDYEGISELKEFSKVRFDVTEQFDRLYNDDGTVANFMLKLLEENNKDLASISFYSENHPNYCPIIKITYESSYAINSSYRTHTHELGRFGQGSIDLQCGNLMFESTDFAWGGNRMPVTIKHLFNSALSGQQYSYNGGLALYTANFKSMKIGNGFKLNLMQSLCYATYLGYIYIDGEGNEIYFTPCSSEEIKVDECCTETYYIYKDVETGEMRYYERTRILENGDDKYQFDENGRLISITDKYNNQLSITYTNDRITSVTDGAGRDFCFDYDNNGFLNKIVAPNHTIENPVLIEYGYSDNNLSTITYEDGRKVIIDYLNDKPSCVTLYDKDNNSVYKVEYTFTNDKLKTVTEYGVENGQFVLGTSTEYTYSAASGRTHVKTTEPADEGETSDNIIDTVYVFDDDGELINEYFYSKDTGNVLAKNDEENESSYVSNVANLLSNHNFLDLTSWNKWGGSYLTAEIINDSTHAKFGNTFLKLTSSSSSSSGSMKQTLTNLPAGQYTFSAYARAAEKFTSDLYSAGACIYIVNSNNQIIAQGGKINDPDSDYTRLIAPFELSEAETIDVCLVVDGMGTAYFDAAQLEKNPFANKYNMLTNSSFENSQTGWTPSTIDISTEDCFDEDHSLKLTGNLTKTSFASQTPSVCTDKDTRETFTLSGWAKGFALPARERNGIEKSPEFNVTATIKYKKDANNEIEPDAFVFDLSTSTEEWQYFSIQFSKSMYREIESLTITCNYNYNIGNAYFDNLQLVRDTIETGLTDDDFADNSDTSSVEDTDSSTNTTNEDLFEFEEFIDELGNALTETTFNDNELGTIYRAFEFTPGDDTVENAGNDLVAEIDARGNKTEYTVDEETSHNKEVIDRCGNITAYEYDNSGKTIKVISKNSNRDELANVSYAYDAFDNMKEIVRGDGLKYVLKYNAFHDLESIGIEGKTDGDLVKYIYKNGGGKLKQITYANGHTMKAKYNSIGQMISEKWYDDANETNLIAHYKYVYDGQGNIVRSIDICGGKEYNYIYEDDKLVRAIEYYIYIHNDFIISKTPLNTTSYTYKNDELVCKHIDTNTGTEHTVFYEKSDDNIMVKFTSSDKKITIRNKTDSFGRKEFDEIQHQSGYINRKFAYYDGEIPETHKDNLKVKSEATTQLVSKITFSDGRTISYKYDAEERITKVIDSIEGVETVTDYTYEALGQLETETVNGVIVNNMTYDNYGNILSKNGVTYTYGDPVWKDKLTKVGDQEIIYDAQGNPTNYLSHTLTWEKGRQLKSFDNNTYTYNANGIRTSKTVDGVQHDFALEGSKILKEEWEESDNKNVIVPLYDNEDVICGIIYNDDPYYFQKNLQGDIIGITDCNSQVVARYSYDAWGVPTITMDNTSCKIATINPYRYRGYYFDQEIGLYYLQSRYYNPVVGRFINADEPETLTACLDVINNNLYCYCKNNVVNDTDEFGNLLQSVLFKIFAGIICGFVIQFFDDIIDYFIQIIVKGKKKATFNACPGDYLSSMVNWSLNFLNPFKNAKVIGAAINSYLPFAIKYGYKLISGQKIQSENLFVDLFFATLSFVVSCVLNYSQKTKLKSIKKHGKTKKQINAKKINIKNEFKLLGKKFEINISITEYVVNFILRWILAFKGV